MGQVWQFQSNLPERSVYSSALVDACDKLLLPWAGIPLRPFDPSFLVLEWDGPRVFYGSTSWVKRAGEIVNARDPYWYDPKTFKPSVWGHALGERYLNHGAKFMTIGQLLSYVPNDEVFVRPDADLKAFTGRVIEPKDIRKRLDEWSAGWTLFNEDLIVAVAEPKRILSEMRVWIVDSEPVTAVIYKVADEGRREPVGVLLHHALDTHPIAAPLTKFACECIEALRSVMPPVYVLDVARVPENEMRVVEINCFHASGFYAPDVVLPIVREVSDYVAKYY